MQNVHTNASRSSERLDAGAGSPARLTSRAVMELVERSTGHATEAEISGAGQGPAGPDVVASRLLISLRDFGRVSALVSTCVAALPPECQAGEPDVSGTLEVAEKMLASAIAGLEDLHKDEPIS